MPHLFQKLRDDTLNWRKEGYPCQDYPLSEKYYATNLKAKQVIVSTSNISANRNSNHWNSIGISD